MCALFFHFCKDCTDCQVDFRVSQPDTFCISLCVIHVPVLTIPTAMNLLDADEQRLSSNGRYAERDIVQVASRMG